MANVYILGTRGIPNRYGGFERLVEVLAPYLAERGHRVTVICQADSSRHEVHADTWHGVERLFVPVSAGGAAGTIQYDWKAFRRCPKGSVALIFGYGTAVFQTLLRAKGIRHAVNMDGIEWQRAKWGRAARWWLRLNERMAARLSTTLVADHPQIQSYLRERFDVASRMIAYGVHLPHESAASPVPTHALLDELAQDAFYLVVARPEPENQIHVLLEGHRRSGSQVPIYVIGLFEGNDYGRRLMREYSQANFVGPLYDASVLNELRRRSLLYLHGHSVGGTNPSLIEAMAAGALICAHDNVYNRWVLGQGGVYFGSADELAERMRDQSLTERRRAYEVACAAACVERFKWSDILDAYKHLVQDLASAR